MKEVVFGAKVECTDGEAGEVVNLLVDPVSRDVAHYVVKEKARPHTERLVPAYLEIESTPELIKLKCTLAELADMTAYRFNVAYQTNPSASMGSDPYGGGLANRTYVIERTVVPQGEQAFSMHSKVEAKDGTVGRVDGVLTDEETGEITHMLMRKGHAWGEKEVVIPVSLIDHSHEGTVYLKVNKDEALDQLTLSAAWGHGPSEDELEDLLDGE